MAKRTEYVLVGRYMDGRRVTGYHLQDISTGKNGQYSVDQFAYLVGRGQVTNCTGQIYQDTVLYRGANGTEINSLPVQHADGSLSRADGAGHLRKGDTAQDAMNKLMLVGKIVQGRNTVGFVVRNMGGQTKNLSYNDTFELVRAGRVGNAKAQMYEGKPLIKGNGVNLNELPVMEMNT